MLLTGISADAVAQNSALPPLPFSARYSTHDHVTPGGSVADDTRYIDVKSPGDGTTYVVGNTTALDTNQTALFSGAPVLGPVPALQYGSTVRRQVAVVQLVDPAQGIDPFPSGRPRQRYFYGETTVGGIPDVTRATSARAIAVWPTGDPTTTRVAICGETLDQRLPLSNAPGGNPGANGSRFGGFIAVFDGEGELQWSHHFFGGNAGDCAVTDVSIRRETRSTPQGPVDLDVVTYCGISSHGNPSNNGTLNVVNPFFFLGTACPTSALGNTDNGNAQWDGFIGRLARPTGGITTPEFHSVVGGENQDGLFGIAEIDASRFAVVGSTASLGTGTGAVDFPITTGACVGSASQYSAGVMMVFQAVGTTSALETSMTLGTAGQGLQSVARDVLVQPRYRGGDPLVVVVGATEDPQFLSTLTVGGTPPLAPVLGPQPTKGPGADGFVFACWMPVANPTPVAASFVGGANDEGLTGVSGWNEFVDHFSVVGYDGNGDIRVASFVVDSDPAAAARPLEALASATIGGSAIDEPTSPAFVQLLAPGGGASLVPWTQPVGFGGPAGGGAAVDPAGRLNVVGSTFSTDYPITAAGSFPAGRPKVFGGFIPNGMRTVFDLLPAGGVGGFRVGRTDGTGQAPAGGVTFPPAGTFGGTTPECALLPFGTPPGAVPPPLSLRRMLIDCRMTPAPGGAVQVDLVVTRIPGAVQVGAVHLGLPGGAGSLPTPLPGGALLWANVSPISAVAVVATDETMVAPLLFPAGSATFTAQLVALPLGGVAGGALGPAPCPIAGTSEFAASPGLWLSY